MRNHRHFPLGQYLYVDLLALFCGFVGGASAIIFLAFIKWGHHWIFGDVAFQAVQSYPWWRIVVPLLLAGLIAGLLSHFLRYRRPLGVVGVVEACALRNGRMSLKEGLLTALLHNVNLALGISAGREGPAIHFAATLISSILYKLRVHERYYTMLLGCVAAGAIGASFNTALAGAFFAWEVIVGRSGRLSMILPLTIAGGGGLLLSYLLYGDVGLFYIPKVQLTSDWVYPAMVVMGIVAGLLSWLFINATNALYYWHQSNHHPILMRTLLGAILLSIIAVYFPQILGVGYQAIYVNLFGAWSIGFILVVFFAKFTASIITLGAGLGGGVWTLAVILGASFGAIASAVFQSLLPSFLDNHTLFIVVGISTFIAAILGSPLTALLFVIEHNGSFDVVLAVLLAVVFARQISSWLFSHSFYSQTLIGEESAGWIYQTALKIPIDLEDIIRPAKIIYGHQPAVQGIARLGEHSGDMIFVVDQEKRFIGVMGWCEAARSRFDAKASCYDIMATERMALQRDSQEQVWEIIEINSDPAFAVVDKNFCVEGYVEREDIMKYIQKYAQKSNGNFAQEIKNYLKNTKV